MEPRPVSRTFEDTLSRTRCAGCGKGLAFDDWSAGSSRCANCLRIPAASGPAATFVRGPSRASASRSQAVESAEAYERLLANVPDELIDELVAALEAEAARTPVIGAPNPVQEVLQEIGFGRSAREMQWAAWGFAGGFAVNVALAKYAQMASGASMSAFLVPMLVGGGIAGITCAAIGWGFAKLRDR